MPGKTPISGFKLQFNPALIPALVKRYNPSNDNDALNAGKAIRDGTYTRAKLRVIVHWKTKRQKKRLEENSDAEIRDALSLAIAARTERAAISVLRGLQGVDTPVASAILTAIDPKRYTVIDFRALEALGVTTNDRSVNFYLCYLAECRQLAEKYKVSLRDFDRALWQWSSEQAQE